MTATLPVLLSEASEGERRAASFNRLAGQLDREAVALAGRLDAVLHAHTDAVWRGPAADRARNALLADQRRLRSAADELRGVGALLRRRAADARARSSQLRRQAERAGASTPLVA